MQDQAARAPKIPVDKDTDRLIVIVDQPQWRHGAWREAELRHQPLGRAKTQSIVRYESGNVLQVGLFRDLEDDQIVTIPLLVAKEEVLARRAADVSQCSAASSEVKTGGCSCRSYRMPSASSAA